MTQFHKDMKKSPKGETLPLKVCKELGGKDHIGEISQVDMFISLNPLRACDVDDFRHDVGAYVSVVGLGGFALSGVAASADISRRSKTASRQGRRPRQAADGMRFERGTTVTPPLAQSFE